ncbi:NYN domain-containing protein [Actinomyces sp.]|uniref:NYN domain-containing protein n=1 Tax=Actinomyces sp. TaxID=29317 RepID=UPI00289E6935|nr:NYN domain-containing protein [Actinomyces sp.]
MTLYVYVDNSNLWIEGMRFSAVRKGMAPSLIDAMKRDITDQSWTYDFGKLYQAICPDDEKIGRSSLFGSRPPANDSLWDLARNQGFEVTTFDRNSANKEKQVDTAISTQIMEDSYEHMKPGDKLVLISGDRDYLPTIQSLHRRGFSTVIAFWEHATGKELKEEPIIYQPLDDLFEYLSR